MLSPRVLLFDFGGTLDGPGIAWPQRFEAIFRRHFPETPSTERFLRAFYDSDDGLAEREPSLGTMDLEKTAERQVFWTLRHLGNDSEALRRSISDQFVNESRVFLDRSRDVLRALRTEHRLGIVSNFYGNLEAILRGEDLYGLFEAVSESAHVGCVKPEARIFEFALEALKSDPQEALMVGDNVKRDVLGARACGLHAAWLKASAGLPADVPTPPEGTLIIDRIEDLPGTLSIRKQAVLN